MECKPLKQRVPVFTKLCQEATVLSFCRPSEASKSCIHNLVVQICANAELTELTAKKGKQRTLFVGKVLHPGHEPTEQHRPSRPRNQLATRGQKVVGHPEKSAVHDAERAK